MRVMVHIGVGISCVLALVACGASSQGPGAFGGKGDTVGGATVHVLEGSQTQGPSEQRVTAMVGDTIVLELKNDGSYGWDRPAELPASLTIRSELDCAESDSSLLECGQSPRSGFDVFTLTVRDPGDGYFALAFNYRAGPGAAPSAVHTLEIMIADSFGDEESSCEDVDLASTARAALEHDEGPTDFNVDATWEPIEDLDGDGTPDLLVYPGITNWAKRVATVMLSGGTQCVAQYAGSLGGVISVEVDADRVSTNGVLDLIAESDNGHRDRYEYTRQPGSPAVFRYQRVAAAF